MATLRSKYIIIQGEATICGVSSKPLPSKLLISKDLIKIQAFLGTYYLPQNHVVHVEELSNNQVLFRHIVNNYPRDIIFSGQSILNTIKNQGYSPAASLTTRKYLSGKGSALKPFFLLGLSYFWMTIYLLPWGGRVQYIYSILMVVVYVSFCLLLLVSRKLQLIITKPERTFREIHKKVIFLTLFLLLVCLPWIILSQHACNNNTIFCKPPTFG